MPTCNQGEYFQLHCILYLVYRLIIIIYLNWKAAYLRIDLEKYIGKMPLKLVHFIIYLFAILDIVAIQFLTISEIQFLELSAVHVSNRQ